MIKKNNRITNQFTRRSEGAFGITGKIGDEGEEWAVKVLEENNQDVKFYPSDKQKQIAGIDIELNGVGIDIKCNLTDEGTFYVEVKPNGWLLNPSKKSPFIWHVNPRNGETYWYLRSDMMNYVKKRNNVFELMKVTDPSSLDFIHKVVFNEKTKVYMGNLPA